MSIIALPATASYEPCHTMGSDSHPSEGSIRMRIAVVALGKIGLPLAVQYAGAQR